MVIFVNGNPGREKTMGQLNELRKFAEPLQ